MLTLSDVDLMAMLIELRCAREAIREGDLPIADGIIEGVAMGLCIQGCIVQAQNAVLH